MTELGSTLDVDPDEYQAWTEDTAIGYAASGDGVTRAESVAFLALAVNGEAGEIAEKAKRIQRGDGELGDLEGEIGDVLWYLARLAAEIDVSLSAVMDENMDKLEDRKDRGVIAGSGDDR